MRRSALRRSETTTALENNTSSKAARFSRVFDRPEHQEPVRKPGVWALKQKDSPLKSKIGLFESLGRRKTVDEVCGGTVKASSNTSATSILPWRGCLSDTEPSQTKGTLRRSSASFLSSRVGRISSKSTSSNSSQCARGKDKPALSGKLPPDHESGGSSKTQGSSGYQHALTENDTCDESMESEASCSHVSHIHGGFDSDGRRKGRFWQSLERQRSKRAPTIAEPGGKSRVFSSDSDIQPHQRSPYWPSHGRRWISRSGGPLVARVQCDLQQPRPVRANEVRRLVSLCRDKMAGRRSRG